VSQKGKTNLDFTEARDSEWQWHQLGHVQVCTSLQQRQGTEGISSPQKSRKKTAEFEYLLSFIENWKHVNTVHY